MIVINLHQCKKPFKLNCMYNIELLRQKPLFSLTVDEFLFVLNSANKPASVEISTPKQGKTYVYGISGLAGLFGCSKTTAGLIKKSGKIDKAISQYGRKITIDAEMALELYKLSKSKSK